MPADPELFERHASDWWDAESAAFRSLHAVNEFRVALLLSWLGGDVRGARVADLGCGGGLLAEPLARAGARAVVGVDVGPGTLAAAAAHRGEDGAAARPLYVRGDARRAPLRSGCSDLALLADVVEHLERWEDAVAEAARLLRPGGHLYVSTINRTWRARLLAIGLAEGVRLVPRGTHDGSRFVKPTELVSAARAVGLDLVHLQGERPRILRTLRRRAIHLAPAKSAAVAYSALFVRPLSATSAAPRAPARHGT